MQRMYSWIALVLAASGVLTGCAAGRATAIPFRALAKTHDIKPVTMLTQVPKRAFEELGLIQLPLYRCASGCSSITALDPKQHALMTKRAASIGADALILRRVFTQEHCEQGSIRRTPIAEGVAVRWSSAEEPKRLTR